MSASGTATGVAHARAALAGNPSDGYGGATLALTLTRWRAEVTATVNSEPTPEAVDPPNELIAAAVARVRRHHHGPAPQTVAITWSTTIPRAVGLGGSSAIVIATLRALTELHHIQLKPAELADLALSIELEDLQIAAGLQDRVAQAYGGLTFMEFDPARAGQGPSDPHERLDPALLPPLVIAWRAGASADSGAVHAELLKRHASGDVGSAMAELADHARRARAALIRGDHDEFARCVDATFDVRARIMELDPRHVEMVQRARRAGAAANYTGSGGAIVAVCRDRAHQAITESALSAIPGCATVTETGYEAATGSVSTPTAAAPLPPSRS